VVDHVAVGNVVLLEVRREDAPESAHAGGLFRRAELLDRPVRLLEAQAVCSQMDVARLICRCLPVIGSRPVWTTSSQTPGVRSRIPGAVRTFPTGTTYADFLDLSWIPWIRTLGTGPRIHIIPAR
jgi:hypothetical protein